MATVQVAQTHAVMETYAACLKPDTPAAARAKVAMYFQNQGQHDKAAEQHELAGALPACVSQLMAHAQKVCLLPARWIFRLACVLPRESEVSAVIVAHARVHFQSLGCCPSELAVPVATPRLCCKTRARAMGCLDIRCVQESGAARDPAAREAPSLSVDAATRQMRHKTALHVEQN